METIIAIPFVILTFCLYILIAGFAGFIWLHLFGIKTFIWDWDDEQNDFTLSYLIQWRFWVNFIVGSLHCYLVYLIDDKLNLLWAMLWGLSPLGLSYIKGFLESKIEK